MSTMHYLPWVRLIQSMPNFLKVHFNIILSRKSRYQCCFIFLFFLAKLCTHFLCQSTACTREHDCWNVMYLTCWQQCLRNVNIWYWFNIIEIFSFAPCTFQRHIPKTNSLMGRQSNCKFCTTHLYSLLQNKCLCPQNHVWFQQAISLILPFVAIFIRALRHCQNIAHAVLLCF